MASFEKTLLSIGTQFFNSLCGEITEHTKKFKLGMYFKFFRSAVRLLNLCKLFFQC